MGKAIVNAAETFVVLFKKKDKDGEEEKVDKPDNNEFMAPECPNPPCEDDLATIFGPRY